jgi:hypothetical protein
MTTTVIAKGNMDDKSRADGILMVGLVKPATTRPITSTPAPSKLAAQLIIVVKPIGVVVMYNNPCDGGQRTCLDAIAMVAVRVSEWMDGRGLPTTNAICGNNTNARICDQRVLQ